MRPADDVFSEWADIGKDEGMARGHTPAVQEILDAAFDAMSPESMKEDSLQSMQAVEMVGLFVH